VHLYPYSCCGDECSTTAAVYSARMINHRYSLTLYITWESIVSSSLQTHYIGVNRQHVPAVIMLYIHRLAEHNYTVLVSSGIRSILCTHRYMNTTILYCTLDVKL
jgi:hypothetical protein